MMPTKGQFIGGFLGVLMVALINRSPLREYLEG